MDGLVLEDAGEVRMPFPPFCVSFGGADMRLFHARKKSQLGPCLQDMRAVTHKRSFNASFSGCYAKSKEFDFFWRRGSVSTALRIDGMLHSQPDGSRPGNPLVSLNPRDRLPQR
jgi:hypothetical protein